MCDVHLNIWVDSARELEDGCLQPPVMKRVFAEQISVEVSYDDDALVGTRQKVHEAEQDDVARSRVSIGADRDHDRT
jgi:hypothetical protein